MRRRLAANLAGVAGAVAVIVACLLVSHARAQTPKTGDDRCRRWPRFQDTVNRRLVNVSWPRQLTSFTRYILVGA